LFRCLVLIDRLRSQQRHQIARAADVADSRATVVVVVGSGGVVVVVGNCVGGVGRRYARAAIIDDNDAPSTKVSRRSVANIIACCAVVVDDDDAIVQSVAVVAYLQTDANNDIVIDDIDVNVIGTYCLVIIDARVRRGAAAERRRSRRRLARTCALLASFR
jgi:hypothetical protein